MTKADIVNEISRTTGIEKAAVQTTVEAFMEAIKGSVIDGKNVYLRGFGSFVVKKRAEKTARSWPGICPPRSAPGRRPGRRGRR